MRRKIDKIFGLSVRNDNRQAEFPQSALLDRRSFTKFPSTR